MGHKRVIDGLRRFRDDARGSAIVLFAGGLLMVFGFGALAVDVGSFFFAKRQLQTANDLAALAAAGDPAKAVAAARATAGRNGYEAMSVESVQPGVYTADSAIPPLQRFQPSAISLANAVRVGMRSETPMYFGRVLVATANTEPGKATGGSTTQNVVAIRSSAIAAQDRQAAFAIGSRLARVENGILNSVLSGLVGGSVSLSAMDYQALATARVDLFDMSKRLATRAGLGAVSFDDVLKGQFRLPDLLGAIQDASRDHETRSGAATEALGRIVSAGGSSRNTFDLQKLVSFGPLGDKPLAGPRPLGASLSALDLVSAAAQIANGTRQIETALALDLPGIATATLKLAIGERPVGSAMIRVGRLGASVHTAQTRLLLIIDLVGSGQASLVRLPLYLELGAATARLAAMECSVGDVTTSRVTLAVKPALVDAWVGQVSNAEFNNFSSAPNPPAATLLNLLGLARVTGRAHATMTNTAETSLAYSYAEIQRGDRKTTSTQNFTATLLARLIGDLDLKVEALGLGIGLGGLADVVGATIGGATASLDRLLNGVLGALGIGLGQADAWVTGVRCGGTVLVQ